MYISACGYLWSHPFADLIQYFWWFYCRNFFAPGACYFWIIPALLHLNISIATIADFLFQHNMSCHDSWLIFRSTDLVQGPTDCHSCFIYAATPHRPQGMASSWINHDDGRCVLIPRVRRESILGTMGWEWETNTFWKFEIGKASEFRVR